LESNWRMNVFDLGWAYSDFTLCGRLFFPVGRAVVNHKPTPSTATLVRTNVIPGSTLTTAGTISVDPTIPHFPYGLAVFTD